MIAFILFGVLALLLIFNVPIAIALGVSSLLALLKCGVPLTVVPQRIFTSLDSFPIMAIPFFVLAGNLMTSGGISKRLIKFADSLLGFIRGGIGIASVLACGFFGALSGSGPATVISIGSMMYPEMLEKGYPKSSIAGLLTVAGGLGPIIPPSIIMVVYGTITNTSIGDMFLSGLLIGVLLMVGLMVTTYFVAIKQKWPISSEKLSLKNVWAPFTKALAALILPVIILGGIYGGIFTPTEAACISVVYAFIVGMFVYKELKLKDIPTVLKKSAVGASAVLFIMATSSIFSWLFAYAGITNTIVEGILGLNLSYTTLLIIIAIVLFIFGFFLEGIATVLLLMPIIFPLAMKFGIHPLHLGMIVVVANVIGQMTPPVAVNIFACSSYSKLSVEEIAKGELPFLLTMVCFYLVILSLPELSTALPALLK